MSKIRLSAKEVRWCEEQAMRDSAHLNASKGENFIEAYDAMVKCRTNTELTKFESKWISCWDSGLCRLSRPDIAALVVE